ncbi:TauD/TfdA family dioxygenase [Nonomuraea sp. NPDC052116]|uniref:TauD/TfdA family dioxygenase n=1 Tax=Nonomuraea sp. NPDC052116 TaxID=3155665 RepID=UPI00342A0DBF
MPGNTIDSRPAELLADTAYALVSAGATADDLFTEHLSEVPPHLSEALAPVVRLPDRTSGRRVIPDLLSAFGDPGPTPAHWKEAQSERTRAIDLAVILVGSVLGQVFGWTGQQDGRLLHNIVPSKGQEDMQVGASSSTPLEWHTEDSFHPRRAELLLLACVRNHDLVGSRVASIRRAGLSDGQIDVLGQPEVMIFPDASYPDDWRAHAGPRRGIRTIWLAEDGPCLRYDPFYSDFTGASPEFMAAYAALAEALDSCAEDVVAHEGDILLLDNDVAVHGRAAYRPRFDGTDRWLKRILVRLDRPRPREEAAEEDFGQTVVEPWPSEAP